MKNFIFGLVLISYEGQTSVLPKSLGQPNIVLILADDLGYGSVNCYGADTSLLKTPNINKLAEEGMKFTNAHTPSSVCSPTRYGLLTGRYPWRSSLKWGVVNPGGNLIIEDSTMTIASFLKSKGYNTAAIGKWHLGYGKRKPVDFTKSFIGPNHVGFDYHFGVPYNHDDHYGVYIENDHVFGLRSNRITKTSEKNFHGHSYKGLDAPQRINEEVTATLTNKAVSWIQLQKKDKPFFLYFSHTAVHDPITPSVNMLGKSACGKYGDFIQDIDLSVNSILNCLKSQGLAENTLVIFTSDNGGYLSKNENSEQYNATVMGLKINGDLKGKKGEIWNGGTKVPFIVRWPDVVNAGKETDVMVNLIDVFSTIIDILDQKLPDSKTIASDSFSFLNVLNSEMSNLKSRKSMVTSDANGIQAVYRGNWKYTDDIPPKGLIKRRLDFVLKNSTIGLYNLKRDTKEERNLILGKVEIVQQLQLKLNEIREASHST